MSWILNALLCKAQRRSFNCATASANLETSHLADSMENPLKWVQSHCLHATPKLNPPVCQLQSIIRIIRHRISLRNLSDIKKHIGPKKTMLILKWLIMVRQITGCLSSKGHTLQAHSSQSIDTDYFILGLESGFWPWQCDTEFAQKTGNTAVATRNIGAIMGV